MIFLFLLLSLFSFLIELHLYASLMAGGDVLAEVYLLGEILGRTEKLLGDIESGGGLGIYLCNGWVFGWILNVWV